MTTRALSSEKLLDIKLFKNLTRRRLPHVLVAFLTSFFTVCVPILMWSGDYSDRLANGAYNYEKYVSRAADAIQETMVLNLVFMFVLGIYFGLITLGYMMKRRSAHFYHALPESRETLYTTSVASALFCVLAGGVVAIVIAFIQLAVNSLLVSEVVVPFLLLLFKNVVYFLVMYAITVFAGSFSGNGLVQALMSLVILFYPLAAYSSIVLVRMVYCEYFWADYYWGEEIMKWLSPVTYAGFTYLNAIRIIPTVVAILSTAALLLGGLEIYKKRAIENSERPIVFKKLGNVLKYMLMFVIAIYVGMFFMAIGYSDFHIFFGIVCGGVLSWMLFNTVLAKSPKAMFKGVKGLLIFFVAVVLFMAVVCYDVFGYDRYVPSENNIKFADISVTSVEYEDRRFTDSETLGALSVMLKNQLAEDKKGYLSPVLNDYTRFTVYTVMYTKLGIPVARTFRISKYVDGAEEFLRCYSDDERLDRSFSKTLTALETVASGNYKAELRIDTVLSEKRIDVSLSEFARTYISEIGTLNYSRVSRPAVASVGVYNITDGTTTYYSFNDFGNVDWPWYKLPVYEDMANTIKILGVEPKYEPPTVAKDDKTYELPITKAFIYDTRYPEYTGLASTLYGSSLESYDCREIDVDTAIALAEQLAWYSDYNTTSLSTFVDMNTDYVLKIVYGDYPEHTDTVQEDYYVYDEYGIKASAVEIDYYYETKEAGDYATRTYLFPEGEVPESVKQLFN